MNDIIPAEHIEHSIFIIRGQKVMIDTDLAFLYGVTAKRLNEAVKRNIKRFPPDFMFQLNREEAEKLRSRSQFATLKREDSLRSQIATLRRGKNIKYLPYVFTEFGVAMLSSVLRSERAILVNIEIMRTFGRLRQLLASHKDLADKLQELEKKYDKKFRIVFDAIEQLLRLPEEPPKEPMGFRP
jgi:ORF6N domain